MHRVHFRKENVTIEVPDGRNLREAAQATQGVDVYAVLGGLLSCHGKGFCGTCLVEVDEPGHLSEPGKRERRWLQRQDPEGHTHLRLSCQAAVHGAVSVVTNPDKREGWKRHPFYSGARQPSWARPS